MREKNICEFDCFACYQWMRTPWNFGWGIYYLHIFFLLKVTIVYFSIFLLVDWCSRVACFYDEGDPEEKTNQGGGPLQPDTSSSLYGRRSKSINHFSVYKSFRVFSFCPFGARDFWLLLKRLTAKKIQFRFYSYALRLTAKVHTCWYYPNVHYPVIRYM